MEPPARQVCTSNCRPLLHSAQYNARVQDVLVTVQMLYADRCTERRKDTVTFEICNSTCD